MPEIYKLTHTKIKWKPTTAFEIEKKKKLNCLNQRLHMAIMKFQFQFQFLKALENKLSTHKLTPKLYM